MKNEHDSEEKVYLYVLFFVLFCKIFMKFLRALNETIIYICLWIKNELKINLM